MANGDGGDQGSRGNPAGGGEQQQDQGAHVGLPAEPFDNPEDQAAFDAMRDESPTIPVDTGASGDGDQNADGQQQDRQQQVAGDDDGGDDDGDTGDQAGDKGQQRERAGQQQPGKDGQQPPDPPRRVSYAKYKSAEERATAAEKRARDLELNQAKLDERLKLINEALMTPPQEKKEEPVDDDPEPDPEKDLFGHNAWLKRQLTKTQERVTAWETGQQQRQQQTETTTALTEGYRDSVIAFAKTEPGFADAYSFMMDTRLVELAEYYFGKDLLAGEALQPEELGQIKKRIVAEEMQIAANAIKHNRDPAKAIFRMAKARGWKPAPAADQQQQQDDGAGDGQQQNGQQRNGAQQQNGKGQNGQQNGNGKGGSVTEEIERINAGQRAAQSLSNGGGSPGNPLTLERLANMKDDEFGAMLEELTPQQLQRIAGG